MSETITLGKSRKDGKWLVLVQPERPFGEHLDAYRKISVKHPVSDEFTRVIIGKIHHSSPALTLVTTEQAVEKVKVEAARQQSVVDIVKSADSRQAKQEKEAIKEREMEHKEAIAEKNEIINRVRKDTNQSTIK